jgi:hypothetical protein
MCPWYGPPYSSNHKFYLSLLDNEYELPLLIWRTGCGLHIKISAKSNILVAPGKAKLRTPEKGKNAKTKLPLPYLEYLDYENHTALNHMIPL